MEHVWKTCEVRKGNFPLSLQRKVFNQCILPVMTQPKAVKLGQLQKDMNQNYYNGTRSYGKSYKVSRYNKRGQEKE